MKTSTALLILALTLLVGCTNDAPPNTEADKAAIRALIKQTAEMNKRGDVSGWVGLFEEGAVYMPPNMQAVDTREGLVEMAESGFRDYLADVVIEPREIEVMGDWAFVRSTVTGVAIPKAAGDTVHVDMKQLVLYHRQHDGTWKIARLMGNRNAYN